METRIKVTKEKDKDGKETTKTETYQERVNTHYARLDFKYFQWADISPENKSLYYVI